MSYHFRKNIILTFVLIIFCTIEGTPQNNSDKQDVGETCDDSISAAPEALPDAGKDYGRRSQWGVSNYIKEAEMLSHSPFSPINARLKCHHILELLLEAHSRFGSVPELCVLLASLYRELNVVDSAIVYLNLAEEACGDTSINESYRLPCFEIKNFLPHIRLMRRNFQEALDRQKESDTATVDSIE